MQVAILTPEQQFPEHRADHIIVPAHDGLLGILPGHAPMVVQLGTGQLAIEHATDPRAVYLIEGGVLQITDDQVTVLAESAILMADVSEHKLIQELQDLDSASYDDELALAQAKSRAHWLKTQLQHAGKSVPDTKQV